MITSTDHMILDNLYDMDSHVLEAEGYEVSVTQSIKDTTSSFLFVNDTTDHQDEKTTVSTISDLSLFETSTSIADSTSTTFYYNETTTSSYPTFPFQMLRNLEASSRFLQSSDFHDEHLLEGSNLGDSEMMLNGLQAEPSSSASEYLGIAKHKLNYSSHLSSFLTTFNDKLLNLTQPNSTPYSNVEFSNKDPKLSNDATTSSTHVTEHGSEMMKMMMQPESSSFKLENPVLFDLLITPALHFDLIRQHIAVIATYLIFLIAVVTARRRRLNTLVIGTVVFLSVFAILSAVVDDQWLVGRPVNSSMRSSYCMFMSGNTNKDFKTDMANLDTNRSDDVFRDYKIIESDLQIGVGLQFYNVSYWSTTTTTTKPLYVNNSTSNIKAKSSFSKIQFYYNDRFELVYGGLSSDCHTNKRRAFEQGLPNPILVVVEYMETVSDYGFPMIWSESLPGAGYFTLISLYFASASLIASILLHLIVPTFSYGLFAMTGLQLAFACVIFYINVRKILLENTSTSSKLSQAMFVESNKIHFRLGHNFYLIAVAAFGNLLFGTSAYLFLITRGKILSTFFELDYDTPWDNRRIAEDSNFRKNVARNVPSADEKRNFAYDDSTTCSEECNSSIRTPDSDIESNNSISTNTNADQTVIPSHHAKQIKSDNSNPSCCRRKRHRKSYPCSGNDMLSRVKPVVDTNCAAAVSFDNMKRSFHPIHLPRARLSCTFIPTANHQSPIDNGSASGISVANREAGVRTTYKHSVLPADPNRRRYRRVNIAARRMTPPYYVGRTCENTGGNLNAKITYHDQFTLS